MNFENVLDLFFAAILLIGGAIAWVNLRKNDLLRSWRLVYTVSLFLVGISFLLDVVFRDSPTSHAWLYYPLLILSASSLVMSAAILKSKGEKLYPQKEKE